MIIVLSIAALGLDIAAACVLLYWAVGLGRVLSAVLKVPTARAGVSLARANPSRASACVVVPAHNEEAGIGALIGSLRAQTHQRLSVVLCLDRCTDRTRELALAAIEGDPRFSILDIGSCPADWAGKVNAAWQGARSTPAIAADLLVFIDADTALDPECVAAAVALMETRKLDLVSLLSTLTNRRWFEWMVQPAATMELLRQYPLVRANRAVGRRAFANGQFMLFSRAAYDAIGGHEAVKHELLEDLALARAIAAAGRPAGLFLAEGLLECRMYDSWEAFRSGWKRIFTEAARCKIGRLNKAAFCNAVMGSVLPVMAAANIGVSACLLTQAGWLQDLGMAGVWLSAVAVALWLLVMALGYRIGRVPLWALPCCAVGGWLVGRILIEAARDLRRGVATMWAGRTYVRTPR